MIEKSPNKIIAGVMTWGVWGKDFQVNDMAERIRTFHESGITDFDHADIYGGYTTEATFGAALRESGIDRSKIQLITKCGIQYVSEARPVKIKHYDYSFEHIIASAEQSLANLQTDYLDVFLLHRPSPLLQPEEVAKAVTRLLESGKIRSFGVSNFTNDQTAMLLKYLPVKFNQIQFSATQHEAATSGALDFMLLHQIKPMAWNPLGSYFKTDSEIAKRLKPVVEELAQKYDVGTDTILLNWILKHPAQIAPVVGTTDVNRLKSQLKALTFSMSTIEWFEIYTAALGHKVP
ncbi:aldo/keto reductase [Flavobacterium sp.]|uniref:aldo/keto reductase n=1 Tax=Flavobacterium sp. TaxID=239 RepID=UPI003B999389